MTTVGGHATTAPVLATRAVDVVEARSFARDLGGTLTHVMVAAAGRAVGSTATGAAHTGDLTVGLAVASRRGQGVDVVGVPGAVDAPLPRVRAAVDDALLHARAGRRQEQRVVLVVVEGDAALDTTPALLDHSTCVLEATPADGDPHRLALTLRGDGRSLAEERAEELLGRIARLVERPYRRLA